MRRSTDGAHQQFAACAQFSNGSVTTANIRPVSTMAKFKAGPRIQLDGETPQVKASDVNPARERDFGQSRLRRVLTGTKKNGGKSSSTNSTKCDLILGAIRSPAKKPRSLMVINVKPAAAYLAMPAG
jgi:hypothetical protein